MNQPGDCFDYTTWGRGLFYKAGVEHRPLLGSIAITNRCNLGCIHCFLQDCRDWEELPVQSWKDILDQLEQAGCLWLTITGGEPLIRPDFKEIYLYAKKKGFLVTVFTNATMVNDALVELWREWPPHVVEISIYGFTAQVYREVTGTEEVRDRCFDTIGRLKCAEIPMRLKTMVLKQNRSELALLKRFCKELEVPFRYDPIISPTLKGCHEPCASQLGIEGIVNLDIEGEDRRQAWRDYLGSLRVIPTKKKLFACMAGKNSFYIYPDGTLSLCVYDAPVFDLKQGTFLEGWQGALKERTELSLPEDHPCFGCMDVVYCSFCAPIAKMETGSEYGFSENLCWLAKERRRVLQAKLNPRVVELCRSIP